MAKKVGLLVCLLFLHFQVLAQSDFCEAVTAILRDAPNDFRNVRGNLMETGVSLKAFKSSIHIPGTIKERFVNSFGLFYEGALAQSTNPDSINTAYEHYLAEVDSCASKMGMHPSRRPSFEEHTKRFDKVAFLPSYDKNMDVKALKGHITVEVDYNKNNGTYTLELFIFKR